MLSTLEQHVSALTRALAGQAQDERDITPSINNSSKISPQLALAIYRNNTRSARINALEAIYPACRNILGEDTFRSIARAYVDADTVGTSDLNRYGNAFNQHMDSILDTGRLPEDYSYLADLIRLEFMVHEACYADPDPEFDFELFEQRVLNGKHIGFQLSHSLGLLDSTFPIHEIWLHNRPESNTRQDSHDIRALTEIQYLLVYRDEYIPVVVPVEIHAQRQDVGEPVVHREAEAVPLEVRVVQRECRGRCQLQTLQAKRVDLLDRVDLLGDLFALRCRLRRTILRSVVTGGELFDEVALAPAQVLALLPGLAPVWACRNETPAR